jgi:hypothetical protein
MAGAVIGLAVPAFAGAVPVASTLTSTTGEGVFDNTIGCPNGDGPSWRYEYTGDMTAATGPLGGIWSGTVEAHDAGANKAFSQPGAGHIRLTTPDRGSLDLNLGGGDCTNAPLTIGSDGNGDPTVSGSIPLTAAGAGGGTGALRNVTGSGTASLAPIGVGPGADNTAKININANLTALAPNLVVGDPVAQYIGIIDFLAGNATVSIPVSDVGPPATVGDAFDVKVTGATVSPYGTLIDNSLIRLTIGIAGPTTGPPISLGRIDNGSAATAVVRIAHTVPNATYVLTVTTQGRDALDGLQAPTTQYKSFTTPLLPSLMLLPMAPII